VGEENDAGNEDKHRDEDQEECPRFVRLDFIVENQGIQESGCGVDSVKHGHHKSRIVDFEAAVEADNLEDSCDRQENDRENGRNMAKLVARVGVSEGSGE